MSLASQPLPPVPDDTTRIARAAFRRGNPYVLLRDRFVHSPPEHERNAQTGPQTSHCIQARRRSQASRLSHSRESGFPSQHLPDLLRPPLAFAGRRSVLSQADILVAMELTSAQDRSAVDDWNEGQADRIAGRRILAALPRLRRGERGVWAPSHGVLAPARFPCIQTLDTSAAPRRPLHADAGTEAALARPDLPALRAALAALVEEEVEAAPTSEKWDHSTVTVLSLKVRQLETDLAAANVQLATLESELAALQ